MSIRAKSKPVINFTGHQGAPVGGSYEVYISADGQAEIDYSGRVNPRRIDAWGNKAAKFGAGLGAAGCGFGGVGGDMGGFEAGKYPAGYGEAGFGCEVFSGELTEMYDGTYQVAAVGVDSLGNVQQSGAVMTELVLAGTPAGPSDIDVTGYDPDTDVLSVTIGLSSDDT